MSINSDSPQLISERRLDAPFGRRLYDQVVIKKLKGVAKFKFLGAFHLLTILWFLLIISPSDRVHRLTARLIEFNSGVKDEQPDGKSVTIPPLVLEFQRNREVRSLPKGKATPIQVLSFVSDAGIPPGAETKAELLTGATNGLIKARLVEPLKVNGTTLLEAGVLLLGQGRSTEERLFVDFRKAVFKDGKSISVSAQAYDLSDTIVGLKGSRVGDIALKIAASSGLSFIAGMASGLQASSYDSSGRPLRPTARDAALNGVAQASGEQAKSYMEDIKNRAPIIEVKSGTIFFVTFDGGNL